MMDQTLLFWATGLATLFASQEALPQLTHLEAAEAVGPLHQLLLFDESKNRDADHSLLDDFESASANCVVQQMVQPVHHVTSLVLQAVLCSK
jgi:hypothetical protein